jgi:hypothetical protein
MLVGFSNCHDAESDAFDRRAADLRVRAGFVKNIQVAESDAEFDSCFDVMSVLRPHLKREEFVAFVRKMHPQGYRLAYLTADDAVQSVAGYRIIDMLRTARSR